MSSSLRPRWILIHLATLLAAFCAVPAHAQTPPAATNPTMPGPPSPPSFGDLTSDKADPAMAAKMVRERNEIRQKAIIDETNQLLDLAKQLKDAVDKTSKDQLSLQVVRKAEEIEKLAKDVKSKMRDGTGEPAS
jgi:hypothetical protein